MLAINLQSAICHQPSAFSLQQTAINLQSAICNQSAICHLPSAIRLASSSMRHV
jgi:hypothetical protein